MKKKIKTTLYNIFIDKKKKPLEVNYLVLNIELNKHFIYK